MNIFSKAAQGSNLSPAERAFLKLLKLWFYTALSTGVMAGAQYLLNNQQVNWVALLYIAGGAFLLSLLGALDKYWTSQGDLPLALLTEAGIQHVEQVAQPAQVPLAPAPIKPVPQPIILPSPVPSSTVFNPVNAATATTQVPQIPFPPVSTLASGASSVPQVAFPDVPTPGTYIPPSFSFHDTGVVPVVPPTR